MFFLNLFWRKVSIALLVGYAAVCSYTIQNVRLTSPRNRNTCGSCLLFSRQDYSDSEIISTVLKSKTTEGILHALKVSTTAPLDNDTLDVSLGSIREYSFNVTTASLRRMAHISVLDSRKGNISPDVQELRKEVLKNLIDVVGNEIMSAQKSPGRRLDLLALSDALQALAILSYRRLEAMQPLAKIVLELLERYETPELYKMGPIRLVQCLQASSKLEIADHPIIYRIFQRLLKPDAVGKLPAKYLAHGLTALSSLESSDPDVQLLSRSFMRRLRKQKIRDEANFEDLLRALVAAKKIFHWSNYQDETTIFGFTIMRAILEKRDREFSATEFTDMITSWSTLTRDHELQDAVIDQLLDLCGNENTMEKCNTQQLEQIVCFAQNLGCDDQARLLKEAGERLVELADDAKYDAKAVVGMVRGAALKQGRNEDVMRPYLEVGSHLFVNDDFLMRCRVQDVAHILWFLSVTNNGCDEEVLMGLGRRLLDPTLTESCSPKLASRILGTFTSILSKQGQEIADEMTLLTSDLFHSYGGHLLTSQLSTAEISSSLYAYAKASYLQDMGIYDHLVSLMVERTDDATVRQLAQSLWSCGRMVAWEKMEHDDQGQEVQAPPYFGSASRIAKELSYRSDELSPIDVTQCIWALGRLRITDQNIVTAFGKRTKTLASSMNSIEISNVLWGLARLDFMDYALIEALTTRLKCKAMIISPREAACVLYALGRLRVKDEAIFTGMSEIIVDQIDAASAQAIANTLWAFRAVQLEPPKGLVTLWATKKLNLDGFQLAIPTMDSPINNGTRKSHS